MNKKTVLLVSIIASVLVLGAICLLIFSNLGKHKHDFSSWNTSTPPSCTSQGTQIRICGSCGFTEYSQIPALGHTEVIDLEVPATCTQSGKTAGKHCSVCQAILVQSNSISAIGHQFNEGEIVTYASCLQNGTKKFTCGVSTCNYVQYDTYSLPTYTPTELYNESLKYVGEIVTYDKNGNEYALGTGFVISADGKIVTNYHVIEEAYSATITINGTAYNIVSVLAYDANIDLAILKINASDMAFANICKNPVNVGETVYAMGSSRGMTNTYSQGIITYANRIVDGVSHIQHDASITHGNSGGPLINIYGEVIGVNTWGISDSQNLNFAVFAGELDNLVYGTPLSMHEFYEKECNPYKRMKDYILSNGTYVSNGYYRLHLGTTYSSDYTDSYDRYAYYYPDNDYITLDYVINNGEFWVYFKITNSLSGSYEWHYFDDMDYSMNGTITAATYTTNTLLGYSYNNITNSSIRSSVRELASIMVSNLCSKISYDFDDIGVTASDLHFYYYS